MTRDQKEYDISKELWREYDFGGRIYRIDNPTKLIFYYRQSDFAPLGFAQQSDTHRIIDSNNVVHCVPRPGIDGCVLRWQNKNNSKPVNF